MNDNNEIEKTEIAESQRPQRLTIVNEHSHDQIKHSNQSTPVKDAEPNFTALNGHFLKGYSSTDLKIKNEPRRSMLVPPTLPTERKFYELKLVEMINTPNNTQDNKDENKRRRSALFLLKEGKS